MSWCLAMAGYAEMVEEQALMIVYGAFLLTGIGVIVGLVRKAWVWFWAAMVPLVGITFLAQPWRFFAALSPVDAIDRDAIEWHSAERFMAGTWAVVVIASLAAAIVLWWISSEAAHANAKKFASAA